MSEFNSCSHGLKNKTNRKRHETKTEKKWKERNENFLELTRNVIFLKTKRNKNQGPRNETKRKNLGTKQNEKN
jgi:hypothetical protein